MNTTPTINWSEHQQQHRLAELELSRQLFELARQQIGRSLGRHFDRAPSRELVRIVELASLLGRRATAMDDQNTDLRQLLDEADQKFYDDIRRVYGKHESATKAQSTTNPAPSDPVSPDQPLSLQPPPDPVQPLNPTTMEPHTTVGPLPPSPLGCGREANCTRIEEEGQTGSSKPDSNAE